MCSPEQAFGNLAVPARSGLGLSRGGTHCSGFSAYRRKIALNLSLVQHKSPRSRAIGSMERAVPFVVALNLTYSQPHGRWIVVTAERRNKRPRHKLNWLELLGRASLALVVLGGIAFIAGMAVVAVHTH